MKEREREGRRAISDEKASYQILDHIYFLD